MAYSPYQNGKMEVLWASVEGRLMAMLEGVEALTLKQLNDTTIAWVEHEYHRREHRELGTTPISRLLDSPDASRPCPESAELASVFRITVKRTLRRSDATVSVEGVRYQVPAPWRHRGAHRRARSGGARPGDSGGVGVRPGERGGSRVRTFGFHGTGCHAGQDARAQAHRERIEPERSL